MLLVEDGSKDQQDANVEGFIKVEWFEDCFFYGNCYVYLQFIIIL